MATHLRDETYCYPACGQAHVETYLTEQIAEVECESCKLTAQYQNALRNRIPSPAQIAAFSGLIEMTAQAPANHHASVSGEMDEDGTLLVTLTEDTMPQMARFNREGRIMGHWF